jgi:hypothetical protein
MNKTGVASTLAKIKQLKLNGWGGACGAAAAKINGEIFANRGAYVAGVNEFWLDKGHARGHVVVSFDGFLWDSDGPVWTAPGGAIGLAPEASAIVGAVIRQAPLAVLRTATANTLHALGRVALGDTLGQDWLEGSITSSLRAYFPPHEIERFRAGLQAQGGLAGLAAPFNRAHAMFLVLGTVGSLLCLLRPGRALALMILIGVAANGFAGGALSGPFDRYQARIAWLVLLPPGLVLVRSVPAPRPRLGTCGQVSRNR